MHLMKSEFSHLSSKHHTQPLIIDARNRNPNIVSYKESFFDDSTCTLCIVMDLADGGDLQ
jgi:serine/threonine protein kinase